MAFDTSKCGCELTTNLTCLFALKLLFCIHASSRRQLSVINWSCTTKDKSEARDWLQCHPRLRMQWWNQNLGKRNNGQSRSWWLGMVLLYTAEASSSFRSACRKADEEFLKAPESLALRHRIVSYHEEDDKTSSVDSPPPSPAGYLDSECVRSPIYPDSRSWETSANGKMYSSCLKMDFYCMHSTVKQPSRNSLTCLQPSACVRVQP